MKRLLLGQRSVVLSELKVYAWRSAIAPISLITILALASSVWLGQAVIAPEAAQAYTSRVSLFLARQLGESYETLIRRAEITARAGAQRSFDADLLVAEVIITVVGESQGISVPILTLQATREQWRNRPDPQYWSTYYPDARALLGVSTPSPPASEFPVPEPPAPQPPAQAAPDL